MPTQNIYPLSDVDDLQDKVTGIRVQRDGEPDLELLWDDNDQEWRLRDQYGEKAVRGDRGNVVINDTDYSVTASDGETRLLVNSSDEIRFDFKIDESNFSNLVVFLEYNQDGSLLLAGDADDNIVIYDTSDFSVKSAGKISDSSLISGTWNTKNDVLVGSDSGNVFIYDSNLNLQQTLDVSGTGITKIDVNSNDNRAAIGNEDSVLVYTLNQSTGNYESPETISVNGEPWGVNWHESTDRLAVSTNSDELTIYDTNLNLTNTISVGNVSDNIFGGGDDAVWRSDGYLAVGVGGDDAVEIYDDNLTLDRTISVPPAGIDSLDFGRDKKLVIGSSDNNFYFYDENFDLISKFTESNANMLAVDISSNVPLASGNNEGIIRLYDVVRNRVDIDGGISIPDTYETTVVNNGTGIVEISEGGSNTITSTVGSVPRLIDEDAKARICKVGTDTFLVEGDIYKETGDGFTQSL